MTEEGMKEVKDHDEHGVGVGIGVAVGVLVPEVDGCFMRLDVFIKSCLSVTTCQYKKRIFLHGC